MNNENEKPRLYRVKSVVDKYDGYKNVTFKWFVSQRKPEDRPPISYEIGLVPSLQDDFYTKDFLRELFTEKEALALVSYVLPKGGNIEIKEIELPIKKIFVGYGSIAVGGMCDFYRLDKSSDYNLPFEVWGYFDLGEGEFDPSQGIPQQKEFLTLSELLEDK